MARTLPHKRVCIVGLGWSGSILSWELASRGIEVIALERGPWRDTATDFGPNIMPDELRYQVNFELFVRPQQWTMTFRNRMSETALPVRKWGAFGIGNGAGGGGVHWNGQTWRYQPYDFRLKSNIDTQYGRGFLGEDSTIQDWPVSYDELEGCYDRFEKLCGTSGKAGNLQGRIVSGGNPFEGRRSSDYPTRPLDWGYPQALFAEAAVKSGYKPFPQPCSNISEAYTNPLGIRMAPCTFCGWCERHGCSNYSKASPQACIFPALLRLSTFEARVNSVVTKVNLDSTGKVATGVTLVHSFTEHGEEKTEELVQPADVVIVCGYAPGTTHLFLCSGIGAPYDPLTGRGLVGKNYSYQIGSGVTSFFSDKAFNPFIATGADGSVVNEYNSGNFDTGAFGFAGGAYLCGNQTNGRPINGFVPQRPGDPRWGKGWKAARKRNYQGAMFVESHGTSFSYRQCYLDLDPTYKDPYGRPLLRMTFDYQPNELKMARFVNGKAAEIMKSVNPDLVTIEERSSPFRMGLLHQQDHNNGGTIMGDSPATSVCNRYCQSWDVSNVFVGGASLFPQAGGYNPTGTVGALAFWLADALIDRYFKKPGPLA